MALRAICLNLGPQDCSYLCLYHKTISLHIVIMLRCLGFDFREQCWPFIYCQFHEGEHSRPRGARLRAELSETKTFFFFDYFALFCSSILISSSKYVRGNTPNSLSAYITLTVPGLWQRGCIVSVLFLFFFFFLLGGFCLHFWMYMHTSLDHSNVIPSLFSVSQSRFSSHLSFFFFQTQMDIKPNTPRTHRPQRPSGFM